MLEEQCLRRQDDIVRGHAEVPAPVPNATFDVPFIVALGGTAKLVVEQIMGLQLGEGPRPLAGSIATNLGNSDLCVVIEHRQGHTAEESKGRVVPITKGFGRLSGISLDEHRIRVRERHDKVMQLETRINPLSQGLPTHRND